LIITLSKNTIQHIVLATSVRDVRKWLKLRVELPILQLCVCNMCASVNLG